MNPLSIEELPITSVSQMQVNDYTILIRFFVKDTLYKLILKEDQDGFFHPFTLSHERIECPYCNGYYECELEKNSSILFQRLIQMPSIRLKWLFIDYENPKSTL